MTDVGERFLVVIRLNERSDLSITTSATHALAILQGETVFAVKSAKVFNNQGKRVTKKDLVGIVDTQQQEHNDKL